MSVSTDSASATSLLQLLRGRPALRSFIFIRLTDALASQILNIGVGWTIYAVTQDPLSLAYVGLAQFLPIVAMALVAGHAADHFDRRSVIGGSLLIKTVCVAMLAFWSATSTLSPTAVYGLLFLISSARAFSYPSMSASLSHVVEREQFPRAVAVVSSVFQICSIAGPALGGVIYAMKGPAVFVVTSVLQFVAMLLVAQLPSRPIETDRLQEETVDKSVLAGVRYIRANRLLLALISLDLFAVLLGGVTALLPIYAKDILAVGPIGLGSLRCAPAVGAAAVGLFLAHRTIERSPGRLMLACVAGFGLSNIVFAVSTSFWLSLVALAIAGGFDMVSVIIRQTLVQLSTPDAMRGRVSAVNWIFIGASNELGEFESGVTAKWFGTVPAAFLGGLGTLVIVALWARQFPELRDVPCPAGLPSS